MIKVVVTGGAGFIGSNLVDRLIGQEYQVSIIDNLSTGKLPNIQSVIDSGKVEFSKGSITNLSLLKKVFSGAKYVFHQAALPSVPRSVKDPKKSHDMNITGTLNVLIAARDAKVKKVIYASSSSVYGDTPTLPKKEEMAPNPMSPYAVSKLAGEYYCKVFNTIYDLKTVCLRYFNVYGPRQNHNSPYAAVIPLFFRKAIAGKPPIIFGDGEQSRDFTFVMDVVDANIQAAESDATGIFNLGNSQRVTINQLARLIINLTGNEKMQPFHKDKRPGDVLHSQADISKAKLAFNYNPKYTLEDGLKETLKSLCL